MRTICTVIVTLMLFSGMSQWETPTRDLLGALRRHLPQQYANYLAVLWPEHSGLNFPRATASGKEREIDACLIDNLRLAADSDNLSEARVHLKSVRFVSDQPLRRQPTEPRETARRVSNDYRSTATSIDDPFHESTGYYTATFTYDLISPLTSESGSVLLLLACSCGVQQVTLADGYGVAKKFNCPDLRR